VPTSQPLRLAVVVGSIRRGRFGRTPADWIAEQARQHEAVAPDVVDLADFDLPHELRSFDEDMPDTVTELAERLGRADAFVVVTPEYNHSYPAGLKTAIDWLGGEWQAKPVGFVSYGGVAGGLRAVEHLRGVFAEVHAVTMRDVVSFHDFWEKFDEDGNVTDPGAVGAAKTMLDQLVWWGTALRDARAVRPYGA
jgi:NAD(P)H-dependent FMN reductase